MKQDVDNNEMELTEFEEKLNAKVREDIENEELKLLLQADKV